MKATLEKQRDLITKLIEQDLVYYRFVRRLDWVGISVSDSYTLLIEDLVYELMGLDDHPDIELIYDQYVSLAKNVVDTENSGVEPKNVATEIYNYLERMRKGN